MLEVALALVAALLFAFGTVLQQKEAQEVSDEDAHRAGFLLRLARRPVWLAGMAADLLGYVAQAIALDIGKLVVVQPIVAATIVFALPLGSRILGQRVTVRQMTAAAVFTLGLGAFLVLANPAGGREDPTTRAALVALAVAAAVCIPLYLGGRFARSPAMKATLLGIATGILWGYSAALTKGVMEDLHNGPLALVTNWQLYALLVVGWASLTLAQLSLQAGALAPAVATQSALDPDHERRARAARVRRDARCRHGRARRGGRRLRGDGRGDRRARDHRAAAADVTPALDRIDDGVRSRGCAKKRAMVTRFLAHPRAGRPRRPRNPAPFPSVIPFVLPLARHSPVVGLQRPLARRQLRELRRRAPPRVEEVDRQPDQQPDQEPDPGVDRQGRHQGHRARRSRAAR